MISKTAMTYGGALYDLAREESLEEQILGELHAVSDLFRQNPEYILYPAGLSDFSCCDPGRVVPHLRAFPQEARIMSHELIKMKRKDKNATYNHLCTRAGR